MAEDRLLKTSAVYQFAAEGIDTATFVTPSGNITPAITIPLGHWNRMHNPKFLRVTFEPCDRNGVTHET